MEVNDMHQMDRHPYRTERLFPPSKAQELAPEIPEGIRRDYEEARDIKGRSPRGAAVLARRALQLTLRLKGFPGRDLAAQIAKAIEDRTIPITLLESFHVLRSVAAYAAHPMPAEGGDLEVEPGELEALFLVLDDALDFFFVRAHRWAKIMEGIDAKMAAAKKPKVSDLVAAIVERRRTGDL